MKLLVLYRPKSEHARMVEEYLDDFGRLYPDVEIELLDAESIEGVNKCELYDILEYPALLAINDDNGLQNMWLGKMLPQKQEVVSYLFS
jgi:hypothetical protein